MSGNNQKFLEQLRGGQLQQLFDFLPGVYFVVKNRTGQVMMANDVAVRLCGFESDGDCTERVPPASVVVYTGMLIFYKTAGPGS